MIQEIVDNVEADIKKDRAKILEKKKDNQIIISKINSHNNENEKTIFNIDDSFGAALDSFKLKPDLNLILSIKKEHLKCHPDKNLNKTNPQTIIEKFYSIQLLLKKAEIIKNYANSDFSKFLNTLLKDITETNLKDIYIYYLQQMNIESQIQLREILQTEPLTNSVIENELEEQIKLIQAIYNTDFDIREQYKTLFKNIKDNLSTNGLEYIISSIKNFQSKEAEVEVKKKKIINDLLNLINKTKNFIIKLNDQIILINKIAFLNEKSLLFPEELKELNFTTKDDVYKYGILFFKHLIELSEKNIEKYYNLISQIDSENEILTNRENNIEDSYSGLNIRKFFYNFFISNKSKTISRDEYSKNTKSENDFSIPEYKKFLEEIHPEVLNLIPEYKKYSTANKHINENKNKNIKTERNTRESYLKKKFDFGKKISEFEQENTKKQNSLSNIVSREVIQNPGSERINDLVNEQYKIVNSLDITIDNLTNTLQQQVQKINEAQAATEQERAAKERKKNRTKKGKELQENGKTAEANYIIFYDSDEDDKEKYTAFVNNNYSFTGLEDVFPHEQSP